jgi:anti-anti-sigma regulatory factor
MAALMLPKQFDRNAARTLLSELDLAISGDVIELDGSTVSQVGQTGLQLLLSARQTAAARGVAFKLTSPSECLTEAALLSGVAEQLISTPVAA